VSGLYREKHGRRTISLVSERTERLPSVKRAENPVPQVDDSVELRVNEGVCGGLGRLRILPRKKVLQLDVDIRSDIRVTSPIRDIGDIFVGQWRGCTTIWAMFIEKRDRPSEEVVHGRRE
jgi:hypothetical protein